METAEEYLQKIQASDLLPKTKQQIVALIGDQFLTPELKEQAKKIIAAEIEEETKGMFVEEDDSDMAVSGTTVPDDGADTDKETEPTDLSAGVEDVAE